LLAEAIGLLAPESPPQEETTEEEIAEEETE